MHGEKRTPTHSAKCMVRKGRLPTAAAPPMSWVHMHIRRCCAASDSNDCRPYDAPQRIAATLKAAVNASHCKLQAQALPGRMTRGAMPYRHMP
eukprot:1151112-Pelagomonas_calceolata.AAC.3